MMMRSCQGELVELCHAGVLFCTVVVADEGAHSLHDAVGGQVEEGLQLVINAKKATADMDNGIKI